MLLAAFPRPARGSGTCDTDEMDLCGGDGETGTRGDGMGAHVTAAAPAAFSFVLAGAGSRCAAAAVLLSALPPVAAAEASPPSGGTAAFC